MSRGIKHSRDRFVEGLASLHVNWETNDGKGGKEEYAVQCALQPIELWSLVFPKEQLEPILRTLNPSRELGITLDKNHIGYGHGSPSRKSVLWAMRKGMGLKPMPEWNPKGIKYPLWTQNIQIVGIGVKDDYENEYKNECL